MSDVSDKRRVFVAYVNCNHAGSDGDYTERVIEAGEDADTIMEEELDELIGNHMESGWLEVNEAELKKLKKEGHV